jgi:hypothetical protein
MSAPNLLDLIEIWVKEKKYPHLTRPDADHQMLLKYGDWINIGDGQWFVTIWNNGSVEASTWSIGPPSTHANNTTAYNHVKLSPADPDMFKKLEAIINEVSEK